MLRRIFWEKGLKLTDELLIKSDQCTDYMIGKALMLASAGRFGLLPDLRKFNIDVEINNAMVKVVSIDCVGLTRNGTFIDVEYDSKFSQNFDPQAQIRVGADGQPLLCICSEEGMRKVDDYAQIGVPNYNFIIIDQYTLVPDNVLPVARLKLDENARKWVNDIDFVPPCLFLSSHEKFEEKANEFKEQMRHVTQILPTKVSETTRLFLSVIWPCVQQVLITMDKEHDLMTPMSFFANLQKYIGAFVCACKIGNNLQLKNEELFTSFIAYPYNFQDVYDKICEGLQLCAIITNEIDSFCGQAVVMPPSPSVDRLERRVVVEPKLKMTLCTVGPGADVKIPLVDVAHGVNVYYTVDGSQPSMYSPSSNNSVTFSSGFSAERCTEPDKQFTIRLLAVRDGETLCESTYNVRVKKNPKLRVIRSRSF